MDTRNGYIYNEAQVADLLKRRPEAADHLLSMKEKQTPFQHISRKVQRNDPCPCGSGLKFKRCHLGRPGDLLAEEIAATKAAADGAQ